MKVCVFGAASNEIDNKYIAAVEQLGAELAKRGHELVFGAGSNGLMGAAARGMKSEGGKITGVVPKFFRDEVIEEIYSDCDEIIFTDTMRQRKQTMEELSSAFIIVPGGIGTFEEMFEVMTLKQLGRHKKPIVFYNLYGYFDKLMEFMNHCYDEGFIYNNCRLIYNVTKNINELILYIENDNTLNLMVSDLKYS